MAGKKRNGDCSCQPLVLDGSITRMLAEMCKLPLESFLSSVEAAVTTMRRVQNVYNAGVDFASNTFRSGAGMPASADGVANPVPSGATNSSQIVRDTMNGLVAFVLPGPDVFSIEQGTSTVEPGGVDEGIAELLIGAFDAQPSAPGAPATSVVIADLLNKVAQQINPGAAATFTSAFASLSFAQKVAVFDFLGQNPSTSLQRLAGLLLFVPAALAYSEAPVFDGKTRTLRAQPLGWILSRYCGVADGHNEFRGYFQGRREAQPSATVSQIQAKN